MQPRNLDSKKKFERKPPKQSLLGVEFPILKRYRRLLLSVRYSSDRGDEEPPHLSTNYSLVYELKIANHYNMMAQRYYQIPFQNNAHIMCVYFAISIDSPSSNVTYKTSSFLTS